MYKLLRSGFFWFDPEKAHYFAMNALRLLCRIPGVKKLIRNYYAAPAEKNQPYSIFNIQFPNRVGLGAGFDKNAAWLTELEALGFGFVEIGTVTPLAQPGNDKPRLFRLPADKALINRMGFNNEGAVAVAARLKNWRSRNPASKLVIGGNIGKNKVTANDDAWKDYASCFTTLFDHVDYFVVNVSSPNTPGLRELQEKDSLRKILTTLQSLNREKATPRPLLLKIAPDLTTGQLDDVIDLAAEINLDGLVATNTTISRDGLKTDAGKVEAMGAGGLSGLPVRERSTEIVKYIIQKTNGRVPVIASGGIFTAADALEKINAGASLVQVWTGFIYEGPGIAKNIIRGL